QELVRLVEQCLAREREMRARHHETLDDLRRLESLTERETEVMRLIVAGRLNKQIADDLGISIKTVEVHRARVMEKMDVRAVAELVQAVLRAGYKAGD
ncbi:MAG: DNA-binding response regulator, partial [Rhodocyclaceae bacterium]|nr:DNA-binding response regulator [Rhodocyclaceae bacterium]